MPVSQPFLGLADRATPSNSTVILALSTVGAENSKAARGTLADSEDIAKDGYEALINAEARVVLGITHKKQTLLSNIDPNVMIASMRKKTFSEKIERYA